MPQFRFVGDTEMIYPFAVPGRSVQPGDVVEFDDAPDVWWEPVTTAAPTVKAPEPAE